MTALPRNRLIAVAALIIIVIAVIVWFVLPSNQPSEPPAATPPPVVAPDQTPAIAILAQLNFSVTIPTGWESSLWASDDIAATGATLGQELPRLRESIAQVVAAFHPESQVLLLQPATSITPTSITPTLVMFAIPRHGLRLEQIATELASEMPLPRLINTSLREDGQPILRIRGEQLTRVDALATRPAEVAIMANYLADELIVLLLVGDEDDAAKSAFEVVLRSLMIDY